MLTEAHIWSAADLYCAMSNRLYARPYLHWSTREYICKTYEFHINQWKPNNNINVILDSFCRNKSELGKQLDVLANSACNVACKVNSSQILQTWVASSVINFTDVFCNNDARQIQPYMRCKWQRFVRFTAKTIVPSHHYCQQNRLDAGRVTCP